MPNAEHLGTLNQGVSAWNKWRDENPNILPDLAGLELPEGELRNANLRRADLRGAKLTECNLTDADLRESTLRGADLSGATGIFQPEKLAGADLAGAKLPDLLEAYFKDSDAAKQISDNAQKLFVAMLAACLYSCLTIATTTDVSLVTTRGSSLLPIIQTSIPVASFYLMAPVLLLAVYFYCHFYLQKLWDELASLPAIFPDGRPLQTKADPWLLSDLVRANVWKLCVGRPFLSYLQERASMLLAWWSVPATLMFFWVRYLPRHEWHLTVLHSVLAAISVLGGVFLYQIAKGTLRGADRPAFEWRSSIAKPRAYKTVALTVACASVLVVTSLAAINGVRPHSPGRDCWPVSRGWRTWVPRALGWIGYPPFADLRAADLSVKPPNWTDKVDADFNAVKGLQLQRANLRYADLSAAFLPVTVLADADLEGADLVATNMRHTELTRANLKRADLVGADLMGADLTGADIQYADFRKAKNLKPSQLNAAKNCCADALLDDSLFAQLDLPVNHNAMVLCHLKMEKNRDPDPTEPLDRAACEVTQLGLIPGQLEAANTVQLFEVGNNGVRSAGKTRVGSNMETPFSVTQIALLYDFPCYLDGSGQTIGIVEFGGGYKDADLDRYFADSKLPKPAVSTVSIDGQTNSPAGPGGADAEVEMNIEVAGAIAPRAQIVVYFSQFTEKGWLDAINAVIHDTAHRPSVLLISWGVAEKSPGLSEAVMRTIDEALQHFKDAGITVVVASGDDGARTHVNFPASSPWVLAVGGTKLIAAGNSISSETAWNDSTKADSFGGATGGGISNFFLRPAWQSAIGKPYEGTGQAMRAIPDVAADASPSTGYLTFFDGQWGAIGGTGSPASLWAGLISLLNQGLGRNIGYLNPFLYEKLGPMGVLRGITPGGDNGGKGATKGYACGPGWNACTGWGSPDGEKLLEALRAIH